MKRILLGVAIIAMASALPAEACKSCKHGASGGGGGGGGGGVQRIFKRSWNQSGGGHQGWKKGGGHHKKKGLDKMVLMKAHKLLKNRDNLDLTPEQQDKIRGEIHTAKKQANTLKAEIENLKIDIHKGLSTESTNASAVKKLIDKKYAAKAKLAKLYVDAQAGIQAVLTKEQIEDIRDFRYGVRDEEGEDDHDHDHGHGHEEIEVEIKR